MFCLSAVVNDRMKQRAVRHMDDDDSSFEDLKDLAAVICLSEIRKRRHLLRGRCRKSPAAERFAADSSRERVAVEGSGSDSSLQSEPPWLSEDECPQKHRVTGSSFQFLLDKIKDHPVFQSKRKNGMAPVEHQLMVFLEVCWDRRIWCFQFQSTEHLWSGARNGRLVSQESHQSNKITQGQMLQLAR